MSEIAMRKWIAKAAIGHRDEYGRQLYRVMQESSPKPTTRILTAVGKKGLFSKEEAQLIASMPVLHGQVLPMLANQVLAMRSALMEIAAITTAEGTEAEDMAAQIQGTIRKAISMQSNLSETPQRGEGAQDLARDILRSLGITNASDKDQNLAKQVQILREALSDNLQAWEGEEESVRNEHVELMDETRAALEATKGSE